MLIKNRKIILIILGTLIFFSLMLLIGFLCSKTISLDINSDMIRNLYNNVNPSSDASIASMLYKEDNLPNEYIIDIGIMAYLNEVGKENATIIPQNKVEEKIKYILGDINYSHKNVYIITSLIPSI